MLENDEEFKIEDEPTLEEVAEELSPSYEEDKKKRNRKITLVGLSALLVMGSCFIGYRIGLYFRDCQPSPCYEETAIVVEEELDEIAPTIPVVVVSPTPNPISLLEGWLGNYEGTADGIRKSDYKGSITTYNFNDHDNLFWLEILDHEYCISDGFCDENRSWGIDMAGIGCMSGLEFVSMLIYLPEEPNNTPGMDLTESTLTINPTDNYPYELVITLEKGFLQGYIATGAIPFEEDLTEMWVINLLEADKSTEKYPCQR